MKLTRQLGNRIRQIRQRAGLTQAQLARELNVSSKAVSSYEQGDANPSLVNLVRLARLGKVTTDWLLTGAVMEHDTPPQEQEITEDELRLLIAYRQASKPRKQVALEIIEALAKVKVKSGRGDQQ